MLPHHPFCFSRNGGALYAQLLALRVSRSDDPLELPRLGRNIEYIGSRVFMPAAILLFVHSTSVFWVLGLALCLWVGPAQASARSFLAQVAPKGHEGQMFGLYTTSGRAVSFLAPALVAAFSALGGDRLGIVGIIVVLVVGATALIRVRPPQQ